MRSIRVSWCLVFLGVLASMSSCRVAFVPVDVTDIPLDEDLLGDPIENFEDILASAGDLVKRELPDAQPTTFSFRGGCADLPALAGIMRLTYTEKHLRLFQDKLLLGFVTIDIPAGTMTLRTGDFTDRYPPTDPISLMDGLGIGEIVQVASRQIRDSGVDDCYASFYSADTYWRVECFPPDSDGFGEKLCDFRIHRLTGEVIPNTQ